VGYLDDANGADDASDAAVLVLATNDSTGRNMVEAKQISDGSLVGKWAFFTPDWEVKAVVGLLPMGGNPRVAVLATSAITGQNKIQIRDVVTGLKSGMFFMGSSAEAVDLGVLEDIDFNGVDNDPAYVGLLKKEGGNNIVRVRDALTGAKIKDALVIGSSWQAISLALLPDLSGNGASEVAALASSAENGLVKLSDYSSGVSLAEVPVDLSMP